MAEEKKKEEDKTKEGEKGGRAGEDKSKDMNMEEQDDWASESEDE